MRIFTSVNRVFLSASLLLMALAASTASASTWVVSVGGSGLIFDPKELTIAPGDTVVFVNGGGNHNVVADDGSFRCAHGCDNDGHGGSGASSNSTWVVDLVFTNIGTFGYYCETHGAPGIGMAGTIIVQPNVVVATPSGDTASAPAMSATAGIILALALMSATALTLVRKRRRSAR